MKRSFLAGTALVFLLTGCTKDINNKEALQSALVDYYNGNQDKMGLSMGQMNVEIGSMTFEKDQAQAMVSIKPKAGGEGMQMSKVFDRKGDKWVVRAGGGSGAAGAGHGTGMPIPPSEGTTPTGVLPPGHPAVPPNKQ